MINSKSVKFVCQTNPHESESNHRNIGPSSRMCKSTSLLHSSSARFSLYSIALWMHHFGALYLEHHVLTVLVCSIWNNSQLQAWPKVSQEEENLKLSTKVMDLEGSPSAPGILESA